MLILSGWRIARQLPIQRERREHKCGPFSAASSLAVRGERGSPGFIAGVSGVPGVSTKPTVRYGAVHPSLVQVCDKTASEKSHAASDKRAEPYNTPSMESLRGEATLRAVCF